MSDVIATTSSPCACTFGLTLIGGVYLLYNAFKLIMFLKMNYFTKLNIKTRYAKAGNWAVVTGASDGIGFAMAKDLARRGLNVCLISRTKSKLEDAATQIKTKYPNVEVKIIEFDFQSATGATYDKLQKELEALQIAVLVNNVGINYRYPQHFDEVPLEEDLNIVKVNCEATMRMTKMVLPEMRKKKSGAIICLGSFSALHPTPLLATYAGTKAFNLQFAEALAAEVKKDRIDVLAVAPNMVVSNMSAGVSDRKPKTSFMFVNAGEMARATLNKLGATTHTDGHPHHAIIEGVLSKLPASFVNNQIATQQFITKKKAEKKLAKQQ